MHHLLRRPLGQAMRARTQRHRRLDPRTIGATGRGEHPPETRPHRLARRALQHLMPSWLGIVPRQRRGAVRALFGFDHDDLINVFRRA